MRPAAPLLAESDASRTVVVWASIDPVDGGVSLYPSSLAAAFENKLVGFLSSHDDYLIREPFAMPLPNGAELSATMRFTKDDASGSVRIDQLTQGGHRWVMRLSIGSADEQ